MNLTTIHDLYIFYLIHSYDKREEQNEYYEFFNYLKDEDIDSLINHLLDKLVEYKIPRVVSASILVMFSLAILLILVIFIFPIFAL